MSEKENKIEMDIKKDQANPSEFQAGHSYLVDSSNPEASVEPPYPGEAFLTEEERYLTQSIGKDSTSIYEIYATVRDDKGELFDEKLMGQLTEFNEKGKRKEEINKIDINKSCSLLQNVCQALNKGQTKFQGIFAKFAIQTGKAFILLKKAFFIHNKKGWKEFLSQNFDGFISERSRYDYMRLARFPNAEKYALLGIDRLLQMISVITDLEEFGKDDPIGNFFEKFKISFNPDSQTLLEEFRKQIDTAINKYKAEKAGINLTPELFEDMVAQNISFTNKLLEELKKIQDSEGDPNKHLITHLANCGSNDNKEKTPKRLESFNKLKSRLQATIKSILGSIVTPDEVELSQVQELIDDLSQLKDRLC